MNGAARVSLNAFIGRKFESKRLVFPQNAFAKNTKDGVFQ